jgi:hypothetical protein
MSGARLRNAAKGKTERKLSEVFSCFYGSDLLLCDTFSLEQYKDAE